MAQVSHLDGQVDEITNNCCWKKREFYKLNNEFRFIYISIFCQVLLQRFLPGCCTYKFWGEIRTRDSHKHKGGS